MYTANGIKIMCQGSLGNDMSEIREGKTVATFDFVTAFGDIFKSCPINPGNGGRHGGKVHVVYDRIGIAALAFAAPDVLFNFFETGFNFPPCAIVLDDLCGGQIEISREKGDPLRFTKDPDYPHRALESLEHDHFCGGHDLAVTSIKNYPDGSMLFPWKKARR